MKKGWLVFLVLLAAAALTLSGILLGKFSREEKIFQEQAALNGFSPSSRWFPCPSS